MPFCGSKGVLKAGRIALVLLSLCAIARLAPAQQNIDELERGFRRPPDNARIMMRWWWFGPAVTKPELEREMRLMKEGGIGGFEVQPVYPVALDDEASGIKNFPFLSDQFIDALRFTSEKARELGLRFDLTLGSGWPFGGPFVPIADAAGKLRFEKVKVSANSRRVKVPDVGIGEKLLAVFLAGTQNDTVAPQTLREITEIRDGAVWLPSELSGPHEVLFFISSRTGMQVKRPAIGSEGYVLNHLDRTATENYLKNVGDRLMQAFPANGSNRPYAIFCDSLEVYGQDWTPDLLDEFEKRRGYDLKPYLPALVMDGGSDTTKIRRDWGLTLTELLNERFLTPLHSWSKRNRTLFRIQNYGVPAATISSNAYNDLSEGEGSQWKTLRASRWASSANHLYGRPVTSSETWTWLHSPVFRATPLDLKAEADRHFLQGINQLIGHGWPYTAPGVEYPGWRFYAAGVYNEKNPWWPVMPDVSLYLQRLSYLLRQGQPANDVALYMPNDDAWAHFSGGNTHMIEILRERVGPELIPKILESGFNLDFFDDDSFLFDQKKYRIVILPGVESIPLATYRKLEAFVRGGGILIATRRLPQLAPGLKATEAETNEVVELSRRLFKDTGARGHFVADEGQLVNTLTTALRPDVALTPSEPDIGFVHRRTADAEVYFIANTANVRKSVKATFRQQGLRSEWWDPFDGSVTAAKIDATAENGTTITLDLEPYASRVLVFTRRSLPFVQTMHASASNQIEIANDWRVSFGANGPVKQMNTLRSWTDDEDTRYFSGVAVYEKEVTVTGMMFEKGRKILLDFGEGQPNQSQPSQAGMQTMFDAPVREAAVVYINDQRAGSVWHPPYSLDVTSLLKPGPNKLRIEVSNTAINYMSGHSLPDYRLLNLRYGERFKPQEMEKVQPVPSGLLGPIRLIWR
ncbi:MAG TPA: glycosyl hydrolase [Pyrinomonadaceae bacterium]|nr:glycosyl hydrolase [Pyrinomonadaceae bacterium]